MNRSDSQIDKLVLVVHGVGDPMPGETVGRFARSLADEAFPLDDHSESVWLSEKSSDTDYVKTFEAQQRSLFLHEQNVRLVEVFWGDQSRVRKGFLGVFQGMIQILFGLRYVAYVGADQKNPFCKRLQLLGLISARILHGPVLAVTFFLGILTMAVLATELMWHESYKGVLWTQIVVAVCCGTGLVSSSVGWRLTRSRVLERFWFWVNVTCLFVAGVMIAKSVAIDAMYPHLAFTDSIRPGLIWYCRILVILLAALWVAEIAVLLGMAYCWFWSAVSPGTHTQGINVGFLLPALAVGVWGVTLPMIWVSARRGIKSMADLSEFAAVFDEAIPLLGLQFLMMLVTGVAVAVVVLRYFIWRASVTVDSYCNTKNPGPRLIVHESLQYVVALSTAVGAAGVLTIGTLEWIYDIEELRWIEWILGEFNRYALLVVVPIGGTVILLVPHLRPAFDIVLDIVNHFYFRPTNMQDFLHDDDEFDIHETTFESGSLFFSQRDAIQNRLKRILSHFRDELDYRPELVVVSHSQGTMIAIESLNDCELGWLRNNFSKITLVTMGSPFRHVYQNYFGHVYPELNQQHWSHLRLHVDRWVNIFRVDDYVGREIRFPKSHEVAQHERQSLIGEASYSNHPIAARGHQRYWSDREVLDILNREVFASECQIRKAA